MRRLARLAAVSGFALLLAAHGRLLAADWLIRDYQVGIQVQPDSAIDVRETIVVDFYGGPHHGIFREIPLSGKDKWGNTYRLRLQLGSVTDDNGAALPTVVTRRGSRMHLRIGDPNTYLQGRQAYVIRYRILRAIHFFEEYDELYWNAIGQEWEVPIESASCVVTIPAQPPPGQVRALGFLGFYGSQESGVLIERPDGRTAFFRSARQMLPGEALTVVVGWPKGIVKQPSLWQELSWFASDNAYVALPFAFIACLFLVWRGTGRDPETGRSEAVRYEPPNGLGPAELGTLIDERVDVKDITGSIINLAVRGYIRIKAETEKGFLSTRTDYTLELKRSQEELAADTNLTGFERSLLDDIFGGASSRQVSDMKNSFYVNLPGLKDNLYDSMVASGYWSHRPDATRSGYQGVGAVVTAAGFILTVLIASGGIPPLATAPVGWGVAVILCGAALIIAARAMPRRTFKGANAMLAAKGFEEYLFRAERGQIALEDKEGRFEKFLPYAMVLGMADRWARAFAGMDMKPPSWYSGDGLAFSAVMFAQDMNSVSSNMSSAMASQPRSSGSGGSSFFSGGSGFSGGFSGGGGGGGGGGAW